MIRGNVARAAAAVSAHDSYYDISLCWFTNRIDILSLPMIDIRDSTGNKSGYRFLSLLRHARRMFMSSEIKLLRIGAIIGFLTISISVILAIITVLWKLMSPAALDVRGWTSLLLAIIFFGGLISFQVGILLEYMSTLLQQARGKPTFFVVDRSKDHLLQTFLKATCRL